MNLEALLKGSRKTLGDMLNLINKVVLDILHKLGGDSKLTPGGDAYWVQVADYRFLGRSRVNLLKN